MSEEQDSWFKSAFGVDLGEAANKVVAEVSATAGQVGEAAVAVVHKVEGAVEGKVDAVAGGIGGAVTKARKMVEQAAEGARKDGVGGTLKKAAEVAAGVAAGVAGAVVGAAQAVATAAAGAAAGTGGGLKAPLGGSVGRGGKNAPDDVRAIQAKLGIPVDGQCGPQTIAAIEAYQRSMGGGKADGRIDAGGATEKAMQGGSGGGSAGGEAPGSDEGSGGVLDQIKAFGEKLVSDPKALVAELPVIGAEALDDDAPDTRPTSGPDPIFSDHDSTFSVLADDPAEFVTAANAFLKSGAAAHMETGTLSVSNAILDAKNNLVRCNLDVTTTTRRPTWGGGRPRGNERDVIKEAQALIQAHEERHRAIMKNGMTQAVAEMKGKPGSQADGILTRWIAKVESEQAALDKREGKIDIIQSGGKITGVRLVPA